MSSLLAVVYDRLTLVDPGFFENSVDPDQISEVI